MDGEIKMIFVSVVVGYIICIVRSSNDLMKRYLNKTGKYMISVSD